MVTILPSIHRTKYINFSLSKMFTEYHSILSLEGATFSLGYNQMSSHIPTQKLLFKTTVLLLKVSHLQSIITIHTLLLTNLYYQSPIPLPNTWTCYKCCNDIASGWHYWYQYFSSQYRSVLIQYQYLGNQHFAYLTIGYTTECTFILMRKNIGTFIQKYSNSVQFSWRMGQ